MDENGLFAAHAEMLNDVKKNKKKEVFNWHWSVDIPASDLERVKMTDVTEEAEKWRQARPADDMYFTHAQYYGDGIQHIVNELKDKPSSNRALYSLLAQKDISKSGDNPIPSFLTFQCSIEGDILYCTATFRALEVSNFLRINLEEIRQNLVEIYAKLPSIDKVHLHIFAFHAYVRSVPAAALRRPKIDVMPSHELLLLMQNGDVRELEMLLGELSQSTTAVSEVGLAALLNILKMEKRANLHATFESKRGILVPQLTQAVNACKELALSRKSASRGIHTAEKIDAFQAAVNNVCETLQAS
ncbi:hypothetical protein [Lampropedia aestuarii]|uniref:hypothetical protein n=1 Tax=Lampropedia aestuarii TaxID=2562762 RepID=UPI002469C4E9|nr:hypothetical protein [Lampropedia aestuarii]MDH5857786.1 hypothetical protein [Lampropedia aestuarii]